MSNLLRALVMIACAGVFVSATGLSASAQSLDDYRAQGILAERFDGYVVVRSADAPAAAASLAAAVNQKRKAVYEQRASEQGVSVAEVGKIYAMEIFEKAPAKTYFQQPNGTYVQK